MNDVIINNLNILKDCDNDNIYKTVAYKRVINNIKKYNKKINTIEDIKEAIKNKEILGIGKGIIKKIEDIFKYGKIKNINCNETINELMNIYGIGYKKAFDLFKNHNIKSIKDFKIEKNYNLLNDKQKIGLKYYEDLLLKIPYKEVIEYEKEIDKVLKTYNLEYNIVGSYRRGNKLVGDIDVLIKNNNKINLKEIVDIFIKKNIIIETLALGENKFLGISKLNNNPARRLDFLLMNPDKYYFGLLYMTGSAEFNTKMRKYANEKGLILNEYGFKDIKTKKYIKKTFNNEKEIFNYLGLEYIEPKYR